MNQQLQFDRAALVWPILVLHAKNKTLLTYGELANMINIHHRVVRHPLNLIQKYCLRYELPPLSILVVNMNGIRGQGFIQHGDCSELERNVHFFNWDKITNPFEGKVIFKKKFAHLTNINDKENQLTEMVLQTTELPAYLFSNKDRIMNLPDQFIELMSVKYKDERFNQFEVINEFFKTFPDWESSPIQRGHVINLFKQNKKYLGFISAMIWGGINASRPKETGNFETIDLYRLLSVKRSKIENIIEVVEKFLIKGEIKECFLFLKNEGKIDGIDYPYFTKLMYFIGQANNKIKIKPLIFDKWTSNGYMALLINSNNYTKLNEFYTGTIYKEDKEVRLRSKVQNAYFNFVLDMEKWASQIGINPSKLEEFIFGVSLKIDKTDINPRIELWDIICKYDESNKPEID